MATLQTRNGSHRILFQYEGQQQTLPVGRVSNTEAIQWKAKVEHLLMRLKQRMVEVPPGCTINEFMMHDGKPPVQAAFTKVKISTLHELREAYLAIFANGAVEANTLYMDRIHLNHIEETYGKNFLLAVLTLTKLQEHITRRQKVVVPITIKKELDTFRAVWNWGSRNGHVAGPFPCKGLVYPKGDEKPPFMSWPEIERRVKAGGDADKLWDALYLRPNELTAFLKFTHDNANRDWLHPFLVTAAYTGARRSELIRMRTEDVNLEEGVLMIREKKRAQGTRTSRHVPISPKVAEALKPLLIAEGPQKQSEMTACSANSSSSVSSINSASTGMAGLAARPIAMSTLTIIWRTRSDLVDGSNSASVRAASVPVPASARIAYSALARSPSTMIATRLGIAAFPMADNARTSASPTSEFVSSPSRRSRAGIAETARVCITESPVAAVPLIFSSSCASNSASIPVIASGMSPLKLSPSMAPATTCHLGERSARRRTGVALF
jgi:site-specific recombinase XerD